MSTFLETFRLFPAKLASLMLGALIFSGCASTLVDDPIRAVAQNTAHCEGAEMVDDSSLAVLPIPVVAFFVPHFDVNEINPQNYLHRCGDYSKLINRQVEVSRQACIPTGLTRIVTLGIWQWCPARVSWEADVVL